MVKPALKCTWSGDGGPDPDDTNAYWEVAVGQTVTLTVQKWDEDTDTAMTDATDNEKYNVSTLGTIKLPAGKIQLVNGEATLTFTPTADCIGMSQIHFTVFDGMPKWKYSAPIRVVA